MADEETMVVAVLVRATYELGATTRAPTPTPIDDLAGPLLPMSWGASVTLAGTVVPERRGDRFRRFRLAFANRASTAVVFGARHWRRGDAELRPSQPLALEPTPLVATLAFGGQYREPPGESEGRPHPGYLARYAANPEGVGFYRSAAEAEGAPLPSIEHEDQLVRAWDDRPEPALFAPCPDAFAARMPTEDEIAHDGFRGPLILAHHAPRRHIADDLAPATEIRVEGLTPTAALFTAPTSPIRVTAMRRGRREPVGGSIRSLHIDADAGRILCTFGHSFCCPFDAVPRDLLCEDGGER